MGHKDAAEIARTLLAAARKQRKEYALFVGAKGESLITPRYGSRYTLWTERWPGSLCGVYTPEAEDVDIIDDVLGMGTRGSRMPGSLNFAKLVSSDRVLPPPSWLA